jgi:hypothetical protein
MSQSRTGGGDLGNERGDEFRERELRIGLYVLTLTSGIDVGEDQARAIIQGSRSSFSTKIE